MTITLANTLTIRRWILLLFSATVITVLSGCGGSVMNVQNPPAPASSAVAISFQPAPASSIPLNATTTLSAVVTNDPTNSGVTWALLCPPLANCGTLSPLHTASATAVTYKPPPVISANSQTFTIEAFATADQTANLVVPITVTGFASSLKGTYVFETKGVDGNGPFQLAGVIRLDGNGNITSGEQTHSDYLLSVSDQISGGSYYVGPDGRGTLTLNTGDVNIGQQGVEDLSLVVLSNSQAFIATLDNPNLPPSTETSSGTLDLQTATTAPAKGYAFAVNGTDIVPQPLAMGGILNIDSPNKISGTGSVADEDDAGTVTPNSTVSGTVSTPDAFGSVTFSLTAGFAQTPLQFTGYIVDATHIKLIESDNNGSGTRFGSTAGLAIAQGSATGTYINNAAFAGNYVFGILGQDLSGLPTSLASVGQFTADASGNLNSGYNDEYLGGLLVEISDSFTGTYTLDPSGDGRVDSSITFASNGPGPELIFYLTGNGNPPLVLDADTNFGSLGVGSANLQGAPPFSFNGKYGVYLTQTSTNIENNAIGQITVNGSADTLLGIVDTNLDFSPQPDSKLTGTFASIPSNGRSTGTLNNTFFPTVGANANTLAVTYYLIDPEHVLFIETDSLMTGELSYGYIVARTPVCPACQ